MGRVTNSNKGKGSRWDIPKGHVEPGEYEIQAAVRECEEETGFSKYDPTFLVDLGCHDYSDNKDIHLFVYPHPIAAEDVKNCRCSAYHINESGEFLEMDRFALIKRHVWKYVMGPSLLKVMTKLYP